MSVRYFLEVQDMHGDVQLKHQLFGDNDYFETIDLCLLEMNAIDENNLNGDGWRVVLDNKQFSKLFAAIDYICLESYRRWGLPKIDENKELSAQLEALFGEHYVTESAYLLYLLKENHIFYQQEQFKFVLSYG